MPRKFDPARDDLFAKKGDDRTYGVSELTRAVRSLLEKGFGFVRVVGEVSGLTVASSGHAYFQLKDDRSSISAVAFRKTVARLGGAVPEEGTEVECLGRLTMYEPRGRTQLILEWIVPRGEGELGLRFLQLKKRLEAEGLFSPERKRPLPGMPGRIGVVTSPTGAALRDILKVLGRRFPSIPVVICPVRVQGEGSAGEIAEALERMGDGRTCDVLIVGRGGGSLEDLWSFNEEIVVRALVASRVPVISAVGHETDLVLSDLAADVRAPTPSAAAELVVPDRESLRRELLSSARGLQQLLALRLRSERARLLEARRGLRDPRLVLAARRQRLDDQRAALGHEASKVLARCRRRLEEQRVHLAAFEPRGRLMADRGRHARATQRLAAAIVGLLERHRLEIGARRRQLASLDPLAVLGRGYSLVSDASGRLVRSSERVLPGEPVRIRLHQGGLDARVERAIPPRTEET